MKTIHKLSIILSGVLISLNINAQNFSYGLQAGANFAVQSEIGNIYDNDDILPGLYVGAFAKLSPTDKLSAQVELNYDQKGSKTDVVTNRYDYLTVPVLFNYELYKGKSQGLSFDVNVGPYVGFLLNAESEFENNELGTIDMNDNTNSAEFGMQTGFSVKYPVGENSVMLKFRYGMAFTDYDINESDLKNKFFGVGLAYEF